MDRYNIFNQIHKGLRSLLYETSILLQQTDFTDPGQAKATVELIHEVTGLFDKHAFTEDNFVLPALAHYEPSVVNVFEEEHDRDHQLSQRLTDLLFVLTHNLSDETRMETGRIINTAFVEFMVFNLQHMAKEETVLNKLLWRYYSDDELHALTQKILAQVPPDMLMLYSKRMMRGLNNPEIIGWLKQVKDNAPEFVFDGLRAIAEKELAPARWQLVNRQVVEEVLVA